MDQPSSIAEVNDNLELIAGWLGVGEGNKDDFNAI